MPGAEHDDLADLKDVLAEAVRDAGAVALSKFRAPVKTWLKGNHSPVTEADFAANDVLRDRLMRAGGDYGWLSEESIDNPARLAAARVWIVDPIDGTRAFMGGLPDWSISAALVEDGRPILGALFAPVEDSLFLAVAGRGATLNGNPIAPSTGGAVASARVSGPKGPVDALRAAERIDVRPRVHSLALRLARIAAGTLDIAFAGANSNDWDLAAADLIVHEAGGHLTTLEGETATYNRPNPVHAALVAAGPTRHASVLRIISNRRAAFA